MKILYWYAHNGVEAYAFRKRAKRDEWVRNDTYAIESTKIGVKEYAKPVGQLRGVPIFGTNDEYVYV